MTKRLSHHAEVLAFFDIFSKPVASGIDPSKTRSKPPRLSRIGVRARVTSAIATLLLVSTLLLSPAAVDRAQASDDVTEKKPLVVYSAVTATTAQLPVMGAIRDGWPENRQIEIEWWKNLDDLRSVVLAGRGDVWIGHMETFGRAAARGAPVTLLAATVWRKFHFLSAPLPLSPGEPPTHPANVKEMLAYAASSGAALASAPQNAPSVGLLTRLKERWDLDFEIETLPPQQLVLELLQGRRTMALMPEPMVSAALARNPELTVVGSLEEIYAETFGGPGLMPQAGVAVNRAFLEREPALAADLLTKMRATAANLSGRPPAEAAALLPPETVEALGLETLTDSLAREPIKVAGAIEARSEIETFLRLAAPELFESGSSALPESFFAPVDRSLAAADDRVRH
jgi:NitT/TauT family transport system substrate-binding protein